jgi:Zinc finger C-x8-C-x5-C-x3-H type (and similar)
MPNVKSILLSYLPVAYFNNVLGCCFQPILLAGADILCLTCGLFYVGTGADPKSVLCAFFKAGQCTKGDKCKFSHDLSIGRKGEKRSLYDDQRDGSEGGNFGSLTSSLYIAVCSLCYICSLLV